jgi:hypothetical protein
VAAARLFGLRCCRFGKIILKFSGSQPFQWRSMALAAVALLVGDSPVFFLAPGGVL